MDKRYQVFISSTYTDLKDERSVISQTLMEMDCIPAGMELFPAIDEDQFNFIKTIIDDSDYYLLIIGGRYGSVDEKGISYTEKEYDYAIEKELKAVVLIHENPDTLPVIKSDTDLELKIKLDAFKTKVSKGRLVRTWKTSKDLPGIVATSFIKTIKHHPAIGWVRASQVPEQSIVLKNNQLNNENEELRKSLISLKPTLYIKDIADIDQEFKVIGEAQKTFYISPDWYKKITWKEIFILISPYLIEHPTQNKVMDILGKLIVKDEKDISIVFIDDACFRIMSIQFKALGLIKIEHLKSVGAGYFLYWSLTPTGESKMIEWVSIKGC